MEVEMEMEVEWKWKWKWKWNGSGMEMDVDSIIHSYPEIHLVLVLYCTLLSSFDSSPKS
jgi:hypothetical protein